MASEARIKLSKRTNITTRYNRKGEVVESYVSSTFVANGISLKARRQTVINMLQEKTDQLEIGGGFANAVARVVMNWKAPRSWKNYRHPKDYITTGRNQMLFKKSMTSLLEEFKLASDLYLRREELGIKEPDKLMGMARDAHRRMMVDFPQEFLGQPQDLRDLFGTGPRMLRRWYASYKKLPDWEVDKVSDEDISAFYIQECAKADSKKPRVVQP